MEIFIFGLDGRSVSVELSKAQKDRTITRQDMHYPALSVKALRMESRKLRGTINVANMSEHMDVL